MTGKSLLSHHLLSFLLNNANEFWLSNKNKRSARTITKQWWCSHWSLKFHYVWRDRKINNTAFWCIHECNKCGYKKYWNYSNVDKMDMFAYHFWLNINTQHSCTESIKITECIKLIKKYESPFSERRRINLLSVTQSQPPKASWKHSNSNSNNQ